MKIQVSLSSDRNYGYFTCKPVHILISRSFLFRMRIASDKSCRKTKHTFFSVNFFFKSSRLWDIVGQYSKAGQAKDDGIIWRMRS